MQEDEERELLRKLLAAGKFLDERNCRAIRGYLEGAQYAQGRNFPDEWPTVQFIRLPEDTQVTPELLMQILRAPVPQNARLMPPPKEVPLPGFSKEDEEAAKAWGIRL